MNAKEIKKATKEFVKGLKLEDTERITNGIILLIKLNQGFNKLENKTKKIYKAIKELDTENKIDLKVYNSVILNDIYKIEYYKDNYTITVQPSSFEFNIERLKKYSDTNLFLEKNLDKIKAILKKYY